MYTKKMVPDQRMVEKSASSVLDFSSQSESLQRKADLTNNAAQREEALRPNNTGLPDNLKSGIENLSGFSMDDVRVHYNSSKPATVQALAYTQGTDIHVAPGQEKHLPHEAWHVAQQMAGRVSPTTNINGMPVNDNAALEHEADVMGAKAVQCKMFGVNFKNGKAQSSSVQRMAFYNPDSPSETTQIEGDAETAELFNRKVGDARNSELARYVDQFKKEMLTYIARSIAEYGDYGPHISVVITGGYWYIAINTDFDNSSLKINAEKVKTNVEKMFDALKTSYEKRKKDKPSDESSKIIFSDKEQALYIAFRWASKRKGVIVDQNPPKSSEEDLGKNDADSGTAKEKKPSKHGEMLTIDYLNEHFPDWMKNATERIVRNFMHFCTEKKIALKEFEEKKIVESINSELLNKKEGLINEIIKKSLGPLIENEDDVKKMDEFNGYVESEFSELIRVVRVGGRKTPCHDCANELGLNDTPMDEHSEVHSDRPQRQFVKGRRVVTMSPYYGKVFTNWSPDGVRKRQEEVKPDDYSGELAFDDSQEQDYNELYETFNALNVTEKMKIKSMLKIWYDEKINVDEEDLKALNKDESKELKHKIEGKLLSICTMKESDLTSLDKDVLKNEMRVNLDGKNIETIETFFSKKMIWIIKIMYKVL